MLGSKVNSQVSLVFSNIIGSKYKNGLPCDLFLAKTQFPRNFRRSAQKSAETFGLQKILSPRKLDEKTLILRCECLEIIIHFRKNMMAQPSFYY